MTYNAADRKHVRAAEKAQLQIGTINREVITGIMSVQNGRHWMYDQLAGMMIFSDPFNPDPYVNAYNAGLRSHGVLLFNEIILYTPKYFILMIEEANERSIIADAVRRNEARGNNGRDDRVDRELDDDADDPNRATDGEAVSS